jgi:chemotaxis protein CheY-P-specific phosphatase CheC
MDSEFLHRLLASATARASETLSEMCGRSIAVSASDLSLCSGRAARGLAWLDETMVGVRVGLTGAFGGRALFLLAPGSAQRLSAILLETLDGTAPGADAALGPLAMSAIDEVGTVMVTAVANELSARLGGPISPSVPRTEIERGRDMLDVMLRDMATGDDGVLVAQMTFTNDIHGIEAMLLIAFPPDVHGAGDDVEGALRWRRSW